MANEKILVVDDDKNICELLRLYLEKEGFHVTLAYDGAAALKEFERLHPDMVLLDVMMPVWTAGRSAAHPPEQQNPHHHADRQGRDV